MTKNEQRILQIVNDTAETADMIPDMGNTAQTIRMLSRKISDIIGEEPGKWYPVQNEIDVGGNAFRCPVCGGQVLLPGTPRQSGWHYCPQCGAQLT